MTEAPKPRPQQDADAAARPGAGAAAPGTPGAAGDAAAAGAADPARVPGQAGAAGHAAAARAASAGGGAMSDGAATPGGASLPGGAVLPQGPRATFSGIAAQAAAQSAARGAAAAPGGAPAPAPAGAVAAPGAGGPAAPAGPGAGAPGGRPRASTDLVRPAGTALAPKPAPGNRQPAVYAPPPAPPARPKGWSVRMPMALGLLALVVLVGGLGTWSVMTTISGAIIATGQIEVERNRQVIQHPDGGVVTAIDVQEGEFVESGQKLIELDDTQMRSQLAIIEGQLFELMARRGRFAAERDDLDRVVFDAELLAAAAARPEVANLVEGQRQLFEARRESMAKAVEALSKRKSQIGNQIDGVSAQQTALVTQLGLIEQELSAQQSLLEKGLAQASRVLALQREEARLLGLVGELTASTAEMEGRITEIEIEILKLGTARREEALSSMRDLEYREAELSEQRRSLLERLDRLVIRAPVSGIVYGLKVFALRSVVRPAEPLLFLVPQDRPLVIASQIETIHIDQVYVGQEVHLRFSAFDQRTTPEILGRVEKVSADAFYDEQTRRSFYRAEIVPIAGELDKLAGFEILPGMPVEAYFRTHDRTPLSYLVKPMTDYFNKAFREG